MTYVHKIQCLICTHPTHMIQRSAPMAVYLLVTVLTVHDRTKGPMELCVPIPSKQNWERSLIVKWEQKIRV